jgi:relaxase-like protein
VIGKVSRGWRVYGLIAYLFGPGRHNEHTDPHVVASWDGCPDLHQPPEHAPGVFEVGGLADLLTAPAVAAGVPQREPPRDSGGTRPAGPVWHCSLRAAPEDRELSDDEWAEVVADVLHRTGIAPRDDPGACRWVAVRHAPDHVHIAAVLVRQDTLTRTHPHRDYLRVGEACQAAEARYGLRRTTRRGDRTAPRAPTRAEREKAARHRQPDTPRDRLRRYAQTAAARAASVEEFLDLVARVTVRTRVRRDTAGRVTGYALAELGDRDRHGQQVWFSGRALAPDLTVPALAARWAAAWPPEPTGPATAPSTGQTAGQDAALVAAAQAAEHARPRVTAGEGTGVAAATGDLLAVLADMTRYHDPTGPVLAEVAERFERAARPGRDPQRWSAAAAELRAAAWRLARTSSTLRHRAATGPALAALLVALAGLVAEIMAWREHRGQATAATDARHATKALTNHATQLDATSGPGGRLAATLGNPARGLRHGPRRSGGQPSRLHHSGPVPPHPGGRAR